MIIVVFKCLTKLGQSKLKLNRMSLSFKKKCITYSPEFTKL